MVQRFADATSAVQTREKGLLDLLAEGASAHPHKLLAVSLRTSITYSYGYSLALRLMWHLLFGCKLKAGATALIYLGNCVEMPSILAAGQAMGLRMVFRAPSLLESCVDEDACLVKPNVFFVEDDAAAQIIRSQDFDQEIISLDGQIGANAPKEQLDVAAMRDEVAPHIVEPTQAQVVLFTSGSTGRPKGVVNRVASFMYNAQRLTRGLGITSEDGFCERVVDEDGWYHTGDAGWIDENGRLYFTGRIRNIIIRGGANIHPSQIEMTYRPHPAVSECAVVGYPDDELGERICLFAVPENDCAPSLDELRAFAAGKLEKGSLPDKLVLLDKIPSLANGKRDTEALKALAARR